MLRCSFLTTAFLLCLSPCAALAQVEFHGKVGYSQGDQPGAYVGLDYGRPQSLVRFDLDAYSAFVHFGDRSSAIALTANYVERYRTFYAGIGVGYIRGRERDDSFDSVATKFLVGSRVPGTNLSLEGSLIWAQHSIGSIHTVGTLSLVYKL